MRNDPVTLVRENLERIPAFTLPPGYSLRWYTSGDEQVWTRIQSITDCYNTIAPDDFIRIFGLDEQALAQRQCFLLDSDGDAIGTATAWFNESYDGLAYGQVHWVAILPTYQGMGLAKPLLTAVCERLRALGHTRAFLHTSTARIPAINLYLAFGFVPQIAGPHDVQAWQAIRHLCKYPLHLEDTQ